MATGTRLPNTALQETPSSRQFTSLNGPHLRGGSSLRRRDEPALHLKASVDASRAVVTQPGKKLLVACRGVGEDFVAGFLLVFDQGHTESGFGNVDAQERGFSLSKRVLSSPASHPRDTSSPITGALDTVRLFWQGKEVPGAHLTGGLIMAQSGAGRYWHRV